MMKMRAFINGKRVATVAAWKNGFLQVFPEKKEFAVLEDWKAAWLAATFEAAPVTKRPAAVRTREERDAVRNACQGPLPLATPEPTPCPVRALKPGENWGS